ncbi:hypothetical protein HZC31_04020 [Candidatus Woesearchaeota archaeon]|nr:hypothetical protein [Candidatus Woesearchaeota archaeon]
MMGKLLELGFSTNEAKVYLALVKLGSGTTSDITKESGVHRVNTYEIIDKLVNKGLVSSLKKGAKTIYSVGDPKNLLRFVEQKEEIARQLVPELSGLYNIKNKREEVFYFTGPEGVITAYYMMLDEKAPVIYGLGGTGLLRKTLKHRHERFNADRLAQGVKCKGLYYESVRSEKEKKPDKLFEIRYLPDSFKTPATVDICGNVVLILLAADMPRVIAIRNKEIAEAYKNYFEFMWKFAKK